MAKTTKSQARTKRERSEFLWGWLFILPTTIGLIVLNIIPIFQTIYQSFFKTGDLAGTDQHIQICDRGGPFFHCHRTCSCSTS